MIRKETCLEELIFDLITKYMDHYHSENVLQIVGYIILIISSSSRPSDMYNIRVDFILYMLHLIFYIATCYSFSY